MTNEEKLSKALQGFKTKYPSVTSADLQTFIIGWQEAVKNCNIPDVSNRRELYFAFMKEYNSLMGESEHQILKEEVEVLLAKYSC